MGKANKVAMTDAKPLASQIAHLLIVAAKGQLQESKDDEGLSQEPSQEDSNECGQ
jgi:hypothetical protein